MGTSPFSSSHHFSHPSISSSSSSSSSSSASSAPSSLSLPFTPPPPPASLFSLFGNSNTFRVPCSLSKVTVQCNSSMAAKAEYRLLYVTTTNTVLEVVETPPT